MNISESNELKARIAALEKRIEALEVSHSEQKSPEIAVRDFHNVQKTTLSLKKA